MEDKMNYYISFLKKEIRESVRTYKLIIMLVAFIFIGIMSPMLAKLTPELLKSLQSDSMQIVIHDTTAIDSWTQFFKNLNQIGFLALLIIFSDSLPKEIQSGTLINVITKGVSRKSIIWGKMSVAWLLWTISYIPGALVAWGYTEYYWGNDGMKHLFLGLLGSWAFGILLLTLLILGEVIGKTLYGGLLVAGGCVVVMFILNIIPDLEKYNPLFLTTANVTLMQGGYQPEDYVKAFIVSAVIMVAAIISSVCVFDKSNL